MPETGWHLWGGVEVEFSCFRAFAMTGILALQVLLARVVATPLQM